MPPLYHVYSFSVYGRRARDRYFLSAAVCPLSRPRCTRLSLLLTIRNVSRVQRAYGSYSASPFGPKTYFLISLRRPCSAMYYTSKTIDRSNKWTQNVTCNLSDIRNFVYIFVCFTFVCFVPLSLFFLCLIKIFTICNCNRMVVSVNDC